MEMTHEITMSTKTTCEATGKYHSGHCRPVANDEGKRFTSIKDAAEYAGVMPQNMWRHLQPNGPRTCKGHMYFYIDNRDESFEVVMNRLAEITAENERHKADEEDARKWREYKAEQERIRKEEEARLEAERKAKEEYEAKKRKLEDKILRRRKVSDRMNQGWSNAIARQMEAEKEYEELTGHTFDSKETA